MVVQQAFSNNFTVAGRHPPAALTTVASSGRILDARHRDGQASQATDTFSPPMSLLVESADASSRCSLRLTGETQMAKKTAASRAKVKELKVQKKLAVKVKGGIARNNKRTD